MKRLIVVLAAALTLSFAGCGVNNAGGSKEGKPVTIKFFNSTIANNGEPKTESEKADVKWYDMVEEKFNVKIETEVPPAANYNERLQIMLAGGDYPDAIAFPDHNDRTFLNAVDNGVVIPVNDYLKDAPNIMKYTNEITWKALKVKGNDSIYAIPRSSMMRADGYFIRKDWLDKFGIKLPEDGVITTDELINIYEAFSNQDPDGNGKKDTYGIISFQNQRGSFDPPFVWPFGVVGWQKHSGNYEYMDETYCLEHDNYKKALEFARQLYQKGYMDPDSLVIKQNAAIDRFRKGVVGSMTNFAGYAASELKYIREGNPKAELSYISAIKGPNGDVKGNLIGSGYYWFWCITKTSKNAELIIKIFDWMLSDECWDKTVYGFEGVTYKNENGVKKPIFDSTGKQVTVSAGKGFLRRADDIEIFIPTKMPDGLDPAMDLRTKWVKQCKDNFMPSLDLGYRPEAGSRPELMDAQKKLDETVSKIIVGEIPVSEYDNALKAWYEAGGREYVKQMNEHIKQTAK